MSIIPDPATTDWVPLAGGGGGGLPQDTVVAGATRIIANKKLAGDAQVAWRVLGDGRMDWGPGGAVGPDTWLYREAASQIRTNAAFTTERAFWSERADTATLAFGSYAPTDTYDRFDIAVSGKMQWGAGTTPVDTNLYRVAANILGTDDTFRTAVTFEATHASAGAAILQAAVGAEPNYRFIIGQNGELTWGPGSAAGDTNLYRWGANFLRTDDSFSAVGSIYTDGNVYSTGSVFAYYASAFWQTTIGFVSGAAGPGIWFSTANDAGIWRIGAGNLATNLLSIRQTNSYDWSFAMRATADTQDRFAMRIDGTMEWGPGGTAARDTNLVRNGVNSLYTTAGVTVGSLGVDGEIVDSGARWFINGTGVHEWGPGDWSRDTNLYRHAADILRTDDTFWVGVGRNLILNNGGGGGVPALQAEFAYGGSARQYVHHIDTHHHASVTADNWMDFVFWTPAVGANTIGNVRGLRVGVDKVWFGNAADTTLYRNGGGFLKTDGALVATTAIYVDNGGGGYSLYFGSAATEYIYRPSAGQLMTNATWVVGGYMDIRTNSGTVPNAVGVYFSGLPNDGSGFITAARKASDSNWVFQITATGAIYWGPGGAANVDTNLYRASTDILKTDDHFQAGFDIYANMGLATQVRIGNSSSTPSIAFGTAYDTIISRMNPGIAQMTNGMLAKSSAGAYWAGIGVDASSASNPNTYFTMYYDVASSIGRIDALSGGVAWRDVAIAQNAYLRVSSGIKFSDGTIQTTSAKKVVGSVNSSGGIVTGTGFTVNKTGTGQYAITFSPAFATTPVVVVSPNNNGMIFIYADGPASTTGFNVISRGTGGAVSDNAFSFHATTA